MLRILGSRKKLCDGLTRREMLLAGGLGLFGAGLGNSVAVRLARGAPSGGPPDKNFGQAKSCILLYLYGSPSQIEMCDPKPDAPVEVRGELASISTTVAGCRVNELLPRVAQIMDRVTLVRSMTHSYPIHSISYALTGLPATESPLDLNPRDPRHWPFMGSVVEHFSTQSQQASSPGGLPNNIALPFPLSSQRPAVKIAGFQPSFLGNARAPVWPHFNGKATRRVSRPQFVNSSAYEGPDPYLGIEPDGHFEIAPRAELGGKITLDRLQRRRSLLEQFNGAQRELDRTSATSGFNSQRQTAFALLSSGKVRRALDIRREPRALRESYGMNLFGQSTLLARRLVEAGCRFVSVIWDEYGTINTAWDTHCNHFDRMKNELLPAFDSAFSSLIVDLDSRGMLDDTLVLVTSEHGRTPQLSDAPGGGRDHWSQCYSNILAGGGIARGRVVGRSDKFAASVMDRPVSPKEILCTAYHLLGIDHHAMLTDQQGRPLPVVGAAEVARDLLA